MRHEASLWEGKVCMLVTQSGHFVTPWTVACRAPLSMEFSRQDYWSGLPFSSSGDLPNPGIGPRCPELQADSLLSEPPGKGGGVLIRQKRKREREREVEREGCY